MFLRYFYDKNLSHASYLVGCQQTGEAIAIDPGRLVEKYLIAAEAEELKIIAVTETHIHADFVSGARELAETQGAKLYLSDEGDENWKYLYRDRYDHQDLRDGDVFWVGNIRFEVIHTPGHTPEHISLILTDTAGADQPMGIFTGDFVFVGSVGRPDLLEKAAGIANTSALGARQMFQSLQRFSQLPDFLQVWPGHGAGSACGKGLGAIPSSTVGYEKLFNPAFYYQNENEFVSYLLADQPAPPKYFAMMKKMNKEGPALIDGTYLLADLSIDEIKKRILSNAMVVDYRPAEEFANGHLSGCINVPFDESIANWMGWLVRYDEPFYLVGRRGNLKGVLNSLRSIGLDNAAGFLESESLSKISAGLGRYSIKPSAEVAGGILSGKTTVIDVRNEDEWQAGHLPGAQHIMLGGLPERTAEIPAENPIVVQCRTGRRSAIGASILKAHGFSDVTNLDGGIVGWSASHYPIQKDNL